MKRLISVLILSLLLVPAAFVNAANTVTVSENVNISLTSPAMTVVLEAGSTYKTMTVTASTIAFTLNMNDVVSMTSSDKYKFNADLSGATETCGTTSGVTYQMGPDDAERVITFSPTAVACDDTNPSDATTSSGGGGGSAVTPVVVLPPAGTQAVSKTINGENGGGTNTTDNRAAMTVPVGLVSGNISLSIDPKASSTYGALGSTYQAVASQVYDFNLSTNGATLNQFTKEVEISFQYQNNDISNIKEDTLKIYYWDTTQSKWVLVGGTLDKVNNVITVKVMHFTVFAVFGEKISTTSETPSSQYSAGDLIKSAGNSAVYYLGADGKRYVFPNQNTYRTWFGNDFSKVVTISATEMGNIQLGGNVTYKPGTRMIKLNNDPKVYTVEPNGVLRHVPSEAVAADLFGANWNKQIDDMVDSFMTPPTYSYGSALTTLYPTGSLVKEAGSATVYYISGTEKRPIADMATMSANYLREEYIHTHSLADYITGTAVSGKEAGLQILH